MMQFEWDESKATGNLKKHGVSFEEAKNVFSDDQFLVFSDPDHSFEEKRFIIMGKSNRARLLVVAYTEKSESIRIISAREATRKEKKVYEEEI
jgi:uncharacterized DUF497 family protein